MRISNTSKMNIVRREARLEYRRDFTQWCTSWTQARWTQWGTSRIQAGFHTVMRISNTSEMNTVRREARLKYRRDFTQWCTSWTQARWTHWGTSRTQARFHTVRHILNTYKMNTGEMMCPWQERKRKEKTPLVVVTQPAWLREGDPDRYMMQAWGYSSIWGTTKWTELTPTTLLNSTLAHVCLCICVSVHLCICEFVNNGHTTDSRRDAKSGPGWEEQFYMLTSFTPERVLVHNLRGRLQRSFTQNPLHSDQINRAHTAQWLHAHRCVCVCMCVWVCVCVCVCLGCSLTSWNAHNYCTTSSPTVT